MDIFKSFPKEIPSLCIMHSSFCIRAFSALNYNLNSNVKNAAYRDDTPLILFTLYPGVDTAQGMLHGIIVGFGAFQNEIRLVGIDGIVNSDHFQTGFGGLGENAH